MIDGVGQAARSYFGSGPTGISFSFDAAALGSLPTDVGLVWTDGATFNTVTFEAWDALGTSLGVLSASNLGDGSFQNGTAEDRFFGWTHAGGISKIHMKSIPAPNSSGSGIEVDHLQYGAAVPVVPVPAAVWSGMALLGALGIRHTLRRCRGRSA